MEEKLREAACHGDVQAIETIISNGTDVNSKHKINGWTALHWAARRNNVEAVKILMSNGAKVDIENNEGKTPGQVAADENVRNILGSTETPATVTETNYVPNYLQNPAFCHKVDLDIVENGAADQNDQPIATLDKDVINEVLKKSSYEEVLKKSSFHQERQEPKSKLLILKIRIANQTDQDFIEMDVEENQRSFQSLKDLMCQELGVNSDTVERIRMLPDTKLRRDVEVRRLEDYAKLELVLNSS